MAGKYYWLKLQRDFFKRQDIKIIDSMPSGKDYIVFYLKLLCESVENEGCLRFNDQIPYNEDMLAIVTDTPLQLVRSAVDAFTKLGMMELLDDGTFFMNEVQNMVGSAANNDNAKRQARFRERNKADRLIESAESTVTKSNESKSIELELETEKEKDIILPAKAEKTTRFVPPTADEVASYCQEKGYDIDAERFVLYYEARGWMIGKQKMKNWRAAVATWQRNKVEREAQAATAGDAETIKPLQSAADCRKVGKSY